MNHLLNALLAWLCFGSTMFFAAGAVADPGAIGGADGDISGGSGGDGAPEGGADDVDQSAISDGDDAAADRAAGEQGDSRGDGRTLPKNIQAALKTLKEAHPELAKDIEELRKGYFGHRQHSEFFKSPAEAREAKAALDLVGGRDGISNLQSQVAAIELVDGALESGDPQVLDDMFADFADGMKKLAGPYLDRLQKVDAQVYAQTLQPHVYQALETAGLGERIAEIYNAVAGNKLDDAKTVLTNIYKWLEGQKQQAAQRAKAPDPERAKFENQVKQFNETKEKSFREDIGRQTVSHQTEQITKSLTPYLKSKNLSAEAKSDLVDGVNREIRRMLEADTTYQSQVKALLAGRNRDAQNIVRYINSRVAEAAPTAVKAVWSRRYGSFTPPRAAAAAAGADKSKPVTNPANAGPVKLTAKPKREDVDWQKTKDILYITNKAFMKNGPHKGKLVTW